MGTTNFPAALDDETNLPQIGPLDREDGVGVEHDVMHSNAHMAILAIQARLGADGSIVEGTIQFRLGGVEQLAEETASALEDFIVLTADALDGKADVAHTHAASDIVSGTLAAARIAGGTDTLGHVPIAQGDGTVTWGAQSGGGGSALQFQDEGSNLGGTDADTVNFTGAGVTASRAGNTINVSISSGGGGGGDGDATLTWLGL